LPHRTSGEASSYSGFKQEVAQENARFLADFAAAMRRFLFEEMRAQPALCLPSSAV
jgi:hypothetical protein